MTLIIVLAVILFIAALNRNTSVTFTVTCGSCGSTAVDVTPNGFKCRNCGAQMDMNGGR